MPAEQPNAATLATSNRPHNNVAFDNDTSRFDGFAKVTGQARYSMDALDGNPIVAAFVRCPWGKAVLESVDAKAAESVPGVLAVNVERVGEEFTYHGQNAGWIAAESPAALRTALRALNCKWNRKDVTTDIDSADPAMPALSADEKTDVDHTLSKADFILDAVYHTQVQSHAALETHGCRVDYFGDRALVHASTQSNFGFRDGLGDRLGLEESKIEINCEYVGGGFGAKFGPGKEGALAAGLAKRFNRPCWVFCDRREEHLDTGNRPSSRQHYRVGVTRSGEILGGSIAIFGGVGVAGGGGGVCGTRYNFGQVNRKSQDVSFNAGAPAAMRAPGHPQGMFAAELAMEEMAHAIGMDPLEFRIKNDPSARRHEMMTKGAEWIGWKNRAATGSQTGVIRTGYGLGITDWPHWPSEAEAEVLIHRDGSVIARCGAQDIGTGFRTLVAVTAAHHLGIATGMVEPRIGSTDLPVGPASGGSVTSPNTVPALSEAAVDARTQLLDLVARQLGVDAASLSITNSEIMRAGGRAMSWKEACLLVGMKPLTGKGRMSPNSKYRGDGHSEGVQFAKVSVDTETGVVRVDRVVAIQACGQVICRKTAESQIIGGVIQGVSYALFEKQTLDRRTGAMVNANLEMYKIAGSADIPRIEPILWSNAGSGARGLGEPPVVPTAGAIACAVFNAIGKPVRSLPMTPDKVLAALYA